MMWYAVVGFFFVRFVLLPFVVLAIVWWLS